MAQTQGTGRVPRGPGKSRAVRAPKAKAGAGGLAAKVGGPSRVRSSRAKILEKLEVAAAVREAAALARLEAARAQTGTVAVEVAVVPPVAGSAIGRRIYTEAICRALADDLVAWLWADEDHYLLPEWLMARGIPRGSVTTSLKNDPVFLAAWDYALTVQEARVLRRGLECRADAQVSKLVLMSQHGYREQQELTAQVGRAALPGTIEEADRQIEQLQAHRAALAQMVEQARQIESAVV